MQVQSYLFFDGRCDEAIEFYKKTLGAEVGMLMRWKDSPDKSMCSPGNENKVMHASLKIGETRVMASDGRNTGIRSSTALHCRSMPRTRPMLIGSSRGYPTAERSSCRSTRRSSRRASA